MEFLLGLILFSGGMALASHRLHHNVLSAHPQYVWKAKISKVP